MQIRLSREKEDERLRLGCVLLPSSFVLLPSSFFLLLSSFLSSLRWHVGKATAAWPLCPILPPLQFPFLSQMFFLGFFPISLAAAKQPTCNVHVHCRLSVKLYEISFKKLLISLPGSLPGLARPGLSPACAWALLSSAYANRVHLLSVKVVFLLISATSGGHNLGEWAWVDGGRWDEGCCVSSPAFACLCLKLTSQQLRQVLRPVY